MLLDVRFEIAGQIPVRMIAQVDGRWRISCRAELYLQLVRSVQRVISKHDQIARVAFLAVVTFVSETHTGDAIRRVCDGLPQNLQVTRYGDAQSQ